MGTLLALLGALSAAWHPLGGLLRTALAQAKKVILPKGTSRESLVQKNPADLDTRNLEITPVKDFGTMGLSDHQVNLAGWRLRINGAVENPLELTYEELLAFPSIEQDVLLICPGFFANHGRWKGVSINNLLKRARSRADATQVVISGPEGNFRRSNNFPLRHVLTDRVFLAYQVNGQTLPIKHGYPLRAVAEGYYGYDWIKYADTITVETVPVTNS
jgi:sulfoxide reductase catalytic subunit YedY